MLHMKFIPKSNVHLNAIEKNQVASMHTSANVLGVFYGIVSTSVKLKKYYKTINKLLKSFKQMVRIQS